jgi:tagaturonate reductase
VLKYIESNNELPKYLLFSLAALIVFYRGLRNGTRIELKDNKPVLDFFDEQWKSNDTSAIVKATLSNTSFWEVDLTTHDGVIGYVQEKVEEIIKFGMGQALENFIKSQQ